MNTYKHIQNFGQFSQRSNASIEAPSYGVIVTTDPERADKVSLLSVAAVKNLSTGAYHKLCTWGGVETSRDELHQTNDPGHPIFVLAAASKLSVDTAFGLGAELNRLHRFCLKTRNEVDAFKLLSNIICPRLIPGSNAVLPGGDDLLMRAGQDDEFKIRLKKLEDTVASNLDEVNKNVKKVNGALENALRVRDDEYMQVLMSKVSKQTMPFPFASLRACEMYLSDPANMSVSETKFTVDEAVIDFKGKREKGIVKSFNAALVLNFTFSKQALDEIKNQCFNTQVGGCTKEYLVQCSRHLMGYDWPATRKEILAKLRKHVVHVRYQKNKKTIKV